MVRNLFVVDGGGCDGMVLYILLLSLLCLIIISQIDKEAPQCEAELFSNWILTSCQPQRVNSGQMRGRRKERQ